MKGSLKAAFHNKSTKNVTIDVVFSQKEVPDAVVQHVDFEEELDAELVFLEVELYAAPEY